MEFNWHWNKNDRSFLRSEPSNWLGSWTFDPEEGAEEMGAELDFAMDWARSAKAEARSGVKVVPGGGTVVEGSGLRAGVPVGMCWPSVRTSGLGTHLGSWRRIGELRVSTTSSMEACGRLDLEDGRVRARSMMVGRPAHWEFWVVRGIGARGIRTFRVLSLKYC